MKCGGEAVRLTICPKPLQIIVKSKLTYGCSHIFPHGADESPRKSTFL